MNATRLLSASVLTVVVTIGGVCADDPTKTPTPAERANIEAGIRREMRQVADGITCARCQGRGYVRLRRKRTLDTRRRERVRGADLVRRRAEDDPLVKGWADCGGSGFSLTRSQAVILERLDRYAREYAGAMSDDLSREVDALVHRTRTQAECGALFCDLAASDRVRVYVQPLRPVRPHGRYNYACDLVDARETQRRSTVPRLRKQCHDVVDALLIAVPGKERALADAQKALREQRGGKLVDLVLGRVQSGDRSVGGCDFTFAALLAGVVRNRLGTK